MGRGSPAAKYASGRGSGVVQTVTSGIGGAGKNHLRAGVALEELTK